ncbi:hypothetical protein DFH09DRAFT_1086949 [Mycena vulgaris]|nr:hypothetical protein DFH09DRAFT_1086949 [Mycena vulgaris]
MWKQVRHDIGLRMKSGAQRPARRGGVGAEPRPPCAMEPAIGIVSGDDERLGERKKNTAARDRGTLGALGIDAGTRRNRCWCGVAGEEEVGTMAMNVSQDGGSHLGGGCQMSRSGCRRARPCCLPVFDSAMSVRGGGNRNKSWAGGDGRRYRIECCSDGGWNPRGPGEEAGHGVRAAATVEEMNFEKNKYTRLRCLMVARRETGIHP